MERRMAKILSFPSLFKQKKPLQLYRKDKGLLVNHLLLEWRGGVRPLMWSR